MSSATIQRITSIVDHQNADNLSVVTLLGWSVVCKKNEFRVGDLIVYLETDTVVAPNKHFDFLSARNYKIKPLKIRGCISHGICFPLSILQDFTNKKDFAEGDDVSDLVGAKHFEKPIPSKLMGKYLVGFPSFLIKTDEYNLRKYPNALNEIVGKEIYICKKIDGCSATFFVKDGNFRVCSRSIEHKPDENIFWSIAKKYDLAYKLLSTEKNLAIQGEVYGPNIQSNPTGIKSIAFAAFNLYNINSQTYADLDELTGFCREFDIPQVPIIHRGKFNHTLQDLIGISNSTTYDNQALCEGIVIRPTQNIKSEVMAKKMWSGKVINEYYELR